MQVLSNLERAIQGGYIQRVYNKNVVSYKVPNVPPRPTRVVISKGTDLTKIIVKSVKDLVEATVKDIEEYILQAHNIEVTEGADLNTTLKVRPL